MAAVPPEGATAAGDVGGGSAPPGSVVEAGDAGASLPDEEPLFAGHVGKIKRATSSLLSGEVVNDQYVVLTGGPTGTVKFFRDKNNVRQVNPRKTIMLKDIAAIRWAGITLSSPVDKDIKLRPPKLSVHDEASYHGITDLFHSMYTFWKLKTSQDRDVKPQRDTELNAILTGALPAGSVLYQPRQPVNPEGAEQEVLRLSAALQLVKAKLMKNKIQYHGLLAKSSSKVGLTVWQVKAAEGQLTFTKPGTDYITSSLDVDVMTKLDVDLISIVTNYGTEISLTPSALSPGGLEKFLLSLEEEWFTLKVRKTLSRTTSHAHTALSLTHSAHFSAHYKPGATDI